MLAISATAANLREGRKRESQEGMGFGSGKTCKVASVIKPKTPSAPMKVG
jgi:hypothetical protein